MQQQQFAWCTDANMENLVIAISKVLMAMLVCRREVSCLE